MTFPLKENGDDGQLVAEFKGGRKPPRVRTRLQVI